MRRAIVFIVVVTVVLCVAYWSGKEDGRASVVRAEDSHQKMSVYDCVYAGDLQVCRLYEPDYQKNYVVVSTGSPRGGVAIVELK